MQKIATGVEMHPTSHGNAIVDFIDDDGKTVASVLVNGLVVKNMPLVATLADLALRKGAGIAAKVFALISD